MSWTGFAAVFVAFFLTHSVPVRPLVKSRLVALLGQTGFGVAYSALSLSMLALLIWSAGEAPYVPLWSQMAWQRHATHLGMFAVCLILALSIARPNPFSFGGARNDRFDPAWPGLIRWTRHPILLALALWASVHVLPNGDLAHVILFAVLGCFALIGRALIDRRTKGRLGRETWIEIDRRRRNAPRVHAPTSWTELGLRLLAGVSVYAALLWAHPFIIGLPAL